ncbi:MAG: hypothetical protein D6735_12220 [Acidobacteria bacterium]|nr:MAG: hypothetical protein D6735_12220 [Acidobacteriota bacterium]
MTKSLYSIRRAESSMISTLMLIGVAVMIVATLIFVANAVSNQVRTGVGEFMNRSRPNWGQ